MEASAALTPTIHNKLKDVFTSIGVLKVNFYCRSKIGQNHISHPKISGICITQPFKNELDWLHKQQTIVFLGVEETSEWSNSFVWKPKPIYKVRLCLNPIRLHDLTINGIFPKLTSEHHLIPIDGSSGYHNLKLDEKSSCLTTFACQCGRYRYMML